MGFPLAGVTLSALTGAFLTVFVQESSSRVLFWASFASIWVLLLVFYCVYRVTIYPHYVSPLRHVPTAPGAHWLYGHGREIDAAHLGMPMRQWVRDVPNDGLIRYFGYFNQERIIVNGPKALSELLVTKPTEFVRSQNLTHTFGRILGRGLILSHGEEHRTHRRILMPAFSFGHVKDLYPTFWAKAAESAEDMIKACGKKGESVLTLDSIASRTTLDLIFLAGMGVDFGAIQNPNSKLLSTYNSLIIPHEHDKTLSFIARFLPARWIVKIPLPRTRYVDQSSSYIRSVCSNLIETRKKQIAEKKELGKDILTLVLQSKEEMSQEVMENQLMTFLLAGHETTSSALIWAVYLLARHQGMQKRLRDEVRAVLPSVTSGDPIIAARVNQMPYLQAFCNETLRYFSPIPMITRNALIDSSLQGQRIPKGTVVIFVPWATNFDPSAWEGDADAFDPERWLTPAADDTQRVGNGGARTNFSSLTFGHGPRDCIGKGFAKGEFATILAGWVSRLSFDLVNPEQADEAKLVVNRAVSVRPVESKLRVTVLPEY
ncbi:hypothetical protein VHEMI01141 [[Torrubiella] hemipterigena]|uniref:Cytochrome P450 n=1 Tax=[Torrubiella] hemipterigena TaxID=1531966 RepID=A0A0A1SSA6_9HYPO|nr:hypothetical protein VHEMI01141 [[Torrubiella] hemipterigena]